MILYCGYEEEAECFEQVDSYNNVTEEARLVVPAHGNNSGIEVIIQESSMMTVENDFCQVSSVPDNIKPSNMEDNAGDVSNRTANSTISSEQETVSSVSGSSSRVSSARSLVSSMWAGSEEPDYDAFAKARRVNLYGQVSSMMF